MRVQEGVCRKQLTKIIYLEFPVSGGNSTRNSLGAGDAFCRVELCARRAPRCSWSAVGHPTAVRLWAVACPTSLWLLVRGSPPASSILCSRQGTDPRLTDGFQSIDSHMSTSTSNIIVNPCIDPFPFSINCIPDPKLTMASMMMMMITTTRQTLRLASRARLFSTTCSQSADVKRLGVVGAGQMVSHDFDSFFLPAKHLPLCLCDLTVEVTDANS